MRWTEVFENYLVSDTGIVRNKKSGRILKISTSPKGYKFYQLRENGKSKTILVSRLVYQKFVGEIPDGYDINHIDGDKSNNHYSNLEAITHHENVLHAVKIGLIKSGRANKYSKQVCQIKWSGEKIFHGSIHEAARSLGKDPTLISLCVNGRRRTAYGSFWIHINDKK